MKHDSPADLVSAAGLLDIRVSEEQARRLVDFERLLREVAVPAGMVAKADLPRLRERHILDCLRAATAVEASDLAAFDLGSGAGLPGIVVAIARPSLALTLVEARRRRAAFLELAAERLSLRNVAVTTSRIEELTGRVDLCFARALAPLRRAWALAEPLLLPGGRLVYFAGEGPIQALEGPHVNVLPAPMLERAGPLVIIARQ